MPRFFINKDEILHNNIKIAGENFTHIVRVLRYSKGDVITLCDGQGYDYLAKIISIDSKMLIADIIDTVMNTTEPHVDVTLYQALPKTDKMELIIQKSVELGVKKIVPVITDRTQIKFGNEKDIIKKVDRWNKISLEASKQCNRGYIPLITNPVDYKNAINSMCNSNLKLIPYENEKNNSIREHIYNKAIYSSISFIVGPEGGFTDDEVKFAKENDVKLISLGPRILRTETVSIMMLSILMYESEFTHKICMENVDKV